MGCSGWSGSEVGFWTAGTGMAGAGGAGSWSLWWSWLTVMMLASSTASRRRAMTGRQGEVALDVVLLLTMMLLRELLLL